MPMPVRNHMAAEGVDADLPPVHRLRLFADGAFAVATLSVAAEALLQLIGTDETEVEDV